MAEWTREGRATPSHGGPNSSFVPGVTLFSDGRGRFICLVNGEIDDADVETTEVLVAALSANPKLSLGEISGWWQAFLA